MISDNSMLNDTLDASQTLLGRMDLIVCSDKRPRPDPRSTNTEALLPLLDTHKSLRRLQLVSIPPQNPELRNKFVEISSDLKKHSIQHFRINHYYSKRNSFFIVSISKSAILSEVLELWPSRFIWMRQSRTRSRSCEELTPSVRGKMMRRSGGMSFELS